MSTMVVLYVIDIAGREAVGLIHLVQDAHGRRTDQKAIAKGAQPHIAPVIDIDRPEQIAFDGPVSLDATCCLSCSVQS